MKKTCFTILAAILLVIISGKQAAAGATHCDGNYAVMGGKGATCKQVIGPEDDCYDNSDLGLCIPTYEAALNPCDNIVPCVNNAYRLGSSTYRWSAIYTYLLYGSGVVGSQTMQIYSDLIPGIGATPGDEGGGSGDGVGYDLGSVTKPWDNVFFDSNSLYLVGDSTNMAHIQYGRTAGVILIDKPTFYGSGSEIYVGTTVGEYYGKFGLDDLTANRTWSFPNSNGTFLMSPAAIGEADAFWSAGGGIRFEGATADDITSTIVVKDPTTPSKTLTVPDSDGTFALASFDTYAIEGANSIWFESNQMVFEGASADGYETMITPVEPTGTRIYYLPDTAASGVMLSDGNTNSVEQANGVWGALNGIKFEGATADAYETTVSPVDPTAARLYYLPDAAASGVMLSDGNTNSVEQANGIWGVVNGIKFEGATADAYETTVSPVDPTAARLYYLPDAAASGVMLSDGNTSSVEQANGIWGVVNGIRFEGATADAYETTVIPVDPTGTRAYYLPDVAASGIMLSDGNTNSVEQANGVWGTLNGIRFEGATADAHSTTITVVDPTGTNVITVPDALSDTFALLAEAQTFTDKTLVNPITTGTLDATTADFEKGVTFNDLVDLDDRTSDPCDGATTSGNIFWNHNGATGKLCVCDNAGDDIEVADGSTCFP